ncbi:large-conductance mechanosensitive channel [Planoprotostelium fungivorum]|uniref:Large-conductance mechanosensitive channel n=1 Tax=Planoprotostelium fungivorum TaxID=1890364 RepID=A0A2P6N564_9EUKA|nr:large-conductance mechanosensitive channel [Planoprotostelium fungivorum]
MDYLLPGLSRTSPPPIRRRSHSDADAGLSEGDDTTTDNVNMLKARRNESFNNLMENLEALASAAGLKDLPTPSPKVVSLWKSFVDFAFQGSVIDLAVGIIIGGAFGKLVNSLVNDMIMPPIGWLLSGVDFANIYFLLKRGRKAKLTHAQYKSLNHAREDGAVTVNVGVFLNSVLNFVVISTIVFTFVRTIHQQQKKGMGKQKKCIYCLNKIHFRAIRCPCCTSTLEPESGRSSPELIESQHMHRAMEESSDEEDGEMKSRTPVMKVYKNKMPNKVMTLNGSQAKPQKTVEGDPMKRKRRPSIPQPQHPAARLKELHLHTLPLHHLP